MEKIEIKASTVEKAVEEGLNQLGILREDAEIEVVQEGGLFSKAVVVITKKESPSDIVINFLNGLFEQMNLRCYADCTQDGEELIVNISGSDSGVIIGYRGEVLDSIQYLALILVNQHDNNFIRVTINAENYREKREQTLEALAGRLAYKAYRTGKKIELEPMNPFERRIIHTALADSKFATTESEGEDLNRHVVIIPKEGGVREGGYDRDNRGGYNKNRNYGDRDNRGGYNRDNRSGGYNRDRGSYNGDKSGGYNRDRSNYNRDNTQGQSAPAENAERAVDFTKRNGPPKFKSYGNGKKRY